MPKLKTETNTTRMQVEVENLFGELPEHDNLSTTFEHGQWWVLCGGCGASWSVQDVGNGLGLEKMMFKALGGQKINGGHKPEYHEHCATQIKAGR